MELCETPPLEALVLDRCSIVTSSSSLWTLLALLAIAFGFWRVAAKPKRSEAILVESPAAPSSKAKTVDHSAPPTPVLSQTTSFSERKGAVFEAHRCCFVDDEEDTGEQFAVEDGGLFWGVVGEEEEEGEEVGGGWWTGDLGWYRLQDPTVLNGSVVKLWDERRERKAASAAAVRRCGSWRTKMRAKWEF